MIRSMVAIALLTVLWSCSFPFAPGQDTELRFSNVSPYELLDFSYQSGGEALLFDRIPSGTTTEYRTIDQSYSYGRVELSVGTKTFVLQPIDYVGEEPLGGGRFTFRVGVDTTSAFGVTLELEDG